MGKNGAGKSTMVKCLMGEIEYDGMLTLGHNTLIGYFAQNEASLLNEEITVFQTIGDAAKGDIRTKIKDILKSALQDCNGTLILVSHDRDFLDCMVNKVFEFGDKQVKEHLGNIHSFLEKKKPDNLRELERTVK